MKRRILLKFTAITTILFLSVFIKIFAQNLPTSELINAEILSNVWYSTTTIKENYSINIYAGFQNHSIKNLSGTAGFFVDDSQISKMNFVAGPKSLIKLETNYTAIRGEHTAQIKIIDIAEAGGSNVSKLSIENLLAKESEKNNFSVKYEITKEEILNKAEDIASNIVEVINTQTEKLATYIESFKQPTNVSSSSSEIFSQISQENITGVVLGTSTENIYNIQNDEQDIHINKNPFLRNIFLDMISLLVRYWIWTLVAGVMIVLLAVLR